MSPLALFGIAAVIAILLILLGMDVGVSFLTASIFYEITTGGRITSFARTAFATNNSSTLLAIPLFMVSGILMERSGIAQSLIDFCESLLKRVKGGMAAVVPLVSMVFGTLCGSGTATVSTIGSIMTGKLEKLGWDRRYISALVAVSGPLGYMIPPNMNAIIFSLVSSASVSALFLATIIPGIIWGVGYIICNRLVYRRYYDPSKAVMENEQGETVQYQSMPLGRATVKAIPAFIMPIIILGGIYSGLCSPTEAGALSALYAVIAGLFIYRKLNGTKTYGCFKDTGTSLGTMMIIFPFVMIFSKIMVLEGLPQKVMSLVAALNAPKFVILIIIDVILLIAGCFFDAPVLTLVLPPMMIPTMNSLGISATHFAVIVFMAIGIGTFTPPMAANLFIAAKVGNTKLRDMLKPLFPYLFFVSLPVMLLVTFVPGLSEWLPKLLIKNVIL